MDVKWLFKSFSIDFRTDISLKLKEIKYANHRSADAARQSRLFLDNEETEVK